MIQLNLLPDVKLEYIRMRRLKRQLLTISAMIAGVSIVAALFLFIGVGVIQKKKMDKLDGEIQASAKQLQGTPDLDRILTIQTQLSALTKLHDEKPVASRLFGYLRQVTPSNVTVSTVGTDFALTTVTITGNARDLTAVNTYVDTLKFTEFKATPIVKESGPVVEGMPFSGVILSTFSPGQGEKEASYSITLTYNPTIFNNLYAVELDIPKQVTTRSKLGTTPTDLFKAPPVPPKEGAR